MEEKDLRDLENRCASVHSSVFPGALALRVTSQDPPERQRRMADPIPPSGSCTPRDEMGAPTVPLPLALLPRGGGIGQNRFQGRPSPLHHLRFTAPAALLSQWGRGMQEAVELSGSDQRDPAVARLHAHLPATGSGVAQHADLPIRKPPGDETDHLPGTLADRVMPLLLQVARFAETGG